MPCKEIKRKREKDQKTVALGLDIIYHHLDIITWISSLMKWQPPTISPHLPTDSLPTGYLLHIAYSTRPDQTRPDQTRPVQIKKNIYIKELRKLKKIKKNKKTTAQSIPMWSPTIVLTLPSTV
jgi:hypothetical protein